MPRPSTRAPSGRITLLVFLAALIPRLVFLSSAPVGHHDWRQSDTAAFARNFATEEFNILHPRIDWRGDTPGYVESEFPAYTFSVAAFYKVFGVHHWIARLLAALASAAGAAVFFKLVELTHSTRTGLWAGLVYAALPVGVFFGRAIMPEAWMLASIIAAVYLFALWGRSGSSRALIGSCAAMSLAILLKPTSLHVGLPLLFLAWGRLGPRCFFKPALWAYAIAAVVPAVLWYRHAAHLAQQTGITFGIVNSSKWASLAPLLRLEWYRVVIFGKIAADHLAVAGAPLLIIGVFLRDRSRRNGLYLAWLLAGAIYVALVAPANEVHDYYQLPLLPAFAFFIGRALEAMWGRRPIATAVICAILLGAAAFTAGKLFKRELPGRPRFPALASSLAACTKPGELVVFIGDRGELNPSVLYLSERKGWVATPVEISPAWLDSLRSRGAVALVALPGKWTSPADVALLKAMTSNDRPMPCADPAGLIVRLRPLK